MSNPVIIHLSDLHVSDHSGKLGNLPNKNSFLDSNLARSENDVFVEKITEKIKKEFADNRKILLITGDISNVGESIEFSTAERFLKKIIKELKIEIEDVCILPGDHDIHRESITKLFRDNPSLTQEPNEFFREKLANYGVFYKSVTDSEFLPEKVIIKHCLISEKTAILCLNSTYLVGNQPANGYINVFQFESEIKDFKDNNPKVENFIVSFHHNISSSYEDKISGQWNLENRKNLIHSFERNNIKMIFYGNEHTSKSGKLDSTGICISESGAVSSIDPLGTFKCYEYIEETNKIYLKNNLFTLTKHNNVTETTAGDWVSVKPASQRHNEEDDFVIIDNTNTIATNYENLEIPESVVKKDITETSAPLKIYDGEYSQKIYEIIKRKKLFQSGHFHWSETSRAHNWIDVTKLLEDKDDLFEVKSSIIDVIEKFELYKDCNLIIGLGYEGNIISSKISIKYDIPYSSLPYSYRYNDHHKFEKQLYFENADGKYKNVLIITDVVNDGRTIRKLIKKDNREKTFFENVEKINVVSLFYSGDRPLNIDVLNTKGKGFSKDYDWENDYPDVDNIDYYTVAKLKVEKCPYSNADYKEACLIYKDKLDCVHLFYDEDKK